MDEFGCVFSFLGGAVEEELGETWTIDGIFGEMSALEKKKKKKTINK